MILSIEQLRQFITPDVKRSIEQKYGDKEPLFKAFVAAHEGTTISQDEARGPQKFNWLASAISKIENFLGSKPVPFFHTHDKTRRTEPLGESVAAGTFQADGKTYSVCVAYIREKFRKIAETLDCVSIECEVRHENNTVHDVTDVSAVAMDNSQTARPAFAEAYELATLANSQAIVYNMTADAVFSQKQNESAGQAVVNVMLSPKEIRSMIQELELKPDQIFNKQQLVESAAVSEHVSAQLQAERAQLEKQAAEMKRQAALAQWQAETQKILADSTQPESFKKLFEARKDSFQPSGDYEQSAQQFVESVKTEHKKLSEMGIIAEPAKPVQRDVKRISQPEAGAVDRISEYFK